MMNMHIHAVVVFIVVFFCASSGITHWRIQEELITAVHGHTVITAQGINDRCSNTNSQADLVKEVTVYDKELSIIIKSVHASKQAPWVPVNRITSSLNSECPPAIEKSLKLKIKDPKNPSNNRCHVVQKMAAIELKKVDSNTISCGEPVEFTPYDFLKGIAQRSQLIARAEPEVAVAFKKSDTDTTVDLLEIEASLRTAVTELPLSPRLLGLIADYWRLKGETLKAVECFRTALSINPDNSEMLLTLARLLFNHHHYDDVIFLTRKSLHLSEDPANSWKQYYLLAESYKNLKKYEDSVGYYRKTLELNPGLHCAEFSLRELDGGGSVANVYTVIIITALVSVVLTIIYYLICNSRHSSTAN